MIQTDPIFLGVVPRGARSYVAREFVRLGKPLFNACAGRFSIVEAVVKSGFPAAKVQASDIGLFSSVLGYLADDSKHLEDLGIRILDPDLEPRDLRDELDFAAHIMLILKLNQLSETNLRGLYLREELRASWFRYREAVREELAGLMATIQGIHYESIEGQDNDQLLAEIYRQIEDAELKLEAFIDEKLDVEIPKVKIEGLDVEIDFKMVLLIFLPRVKERLDKALEYLRSSGQRLDGVYIAADSDYAPLEKAVRKINEEYDVRVVADIIGKMADLALEACGESVADPERTSLKDVFGTTWVPKEAASVIRDAVQKMVKAGDVGQQNRWQVLEYWAAEYLQQ